MRNRGPIVTLLAVVALAAVLLVVNEATIAIAVQGARGAAATGTLEANAMFGRVSVSGMQWPYSVRLATPPAGLYQGSGTVNGAPNRIGWIVLPDGSQVGVRNKNGTREPAPGLDPRALRAVTVEGGRIEPQRCGFSRRSE